MRGCVSGAVAPVACLFALVACGGRADETPSVEAPATAPRAESVAGPSPAVPPATRHGIVSFTATDYNAIASAYFGDGPRPVAPSGCELRSRGDGDTGTSHLASAIAVTYPSSQGEPRRLEPRLSEFGSYTVTESFGFERRQVEQPGGTILFEVKGGQVPAVSGEVVAPSHVKLAGEWRADATDPTAWLGAKSGRDVELVWSEGTHEQAEVLLSTVAKVIRCTFPAPARAGKIPAAMVAELLAEGEAVPECSPGRKCLSGYVSAVRSRNVRAAEYDVELVAKFLQRVSIEVSP